MADMIGGVWSNDNPKFRVGFRYDWAFNQTAVRGIGIIDKGGPNETPVESTFGWDPAKKTVYYLDQHGSEGVYKGTLHLDGDSVILDFETLIGPPAMWRSVGRFPDKDTYQFTIYGRKDSKWTPVVEQTLKCRQPPADESRQITEGIIDAPPDAVWNAFATKDGQEAWNGPCRHRPENRRQHADALRSEGQDRQSQHHRKHYPRLRAEEDAEHQSRQTAREIPVQGGDQKRLACSVFRGSGTGPHPPARRRPGLRHG